MNTETYNGWRNYETWVVNLWLTNDEGSQVYWRSQAQECSGEADDAEQVASGIWSTAEAARFMLADRLKQEIEDGSPLNDQPSLYGDLLNAALSEVDWVEIAESFLGE